MNRIFRGGVVAHHNRALTSQIETALRRIANYDLQWEAEVRGWIAEVLSETLEGDTLQEVLKDGQVLCRFVNKIKPGSVKKINKRTLALMQMENIKLFLEGIVCF